jgi:hypothetical protein
MHIDRFSLDSSWEQVGGKTEWKQTSWVRMENLNAPFESEQQIGSINLNENLNEGTQLKWFEWKPVSSDDQMLHFALFRKPKLEAIVRSYNHRIAKN